MAWLITDALPIDVYMAASKTVDFIVEGFDRAKAAIIITVRPDEICDTLSRFDIKNLPAKDSSSEKVPLK